MQDYTILNTKPHGNLGIHGQEQPNTTKLTLEVEIDEDNGETIR